VNKYFYPFEVFEWEGNAYTKKYILDMVENGKCCQCHQPLTSCDCPVSESEKEAELGKTLKVFQMRRKFWGEYKGNYNDTEEIVKYAQQVIDYHK